MKRLAKPRKRIRESKVTNRDYKKYHLSIYTKLESRLVMSNAFWQLTPTAMRVLLVFLLKRRFSKAPKGRKGRDYRRFIENNSEIEFTYSEAGDYGINSDSFRNAIVELGFYGFIEITVEGSQGRPTKFSIIDKWIDYPDIETKRIYKRKSTEAFGGKDFGKKKQKSHLEKSKLANFEKSKNRNSHNFEKSKL